MRDVLCNTSPLLYLHQIARLDLLPELYQRVVIPEAVAVELREGARLGHAVPTVEALPWLVVEKVENAAVLQLVANLDAGEREVLALAVRRSSSLLLLDDGQARRYATMLGLTFTGTLGVLLRAKQRGLLDHVGPCLDQLQALGFRLAPALRSSVLKIADEAG